MEKRVDVEIGTPHYYCDAGRGVGYGQHHTYPYQPSMEGVCGAGELTQFA